MNERTVRYAVKKFIDDRKSGWVTGIVHGGSQRAMEVAVSRFTPPYSPYHISVHCTSIPVTLYGSSGSQTRVVVDISETYAVVIELADYMFSLPDEGTLYETMLMDFLTVRDRIIKSLKAVIKSPGYLLSVDGLLKYKFTDTGGSFISVDNSEEFIIDNIPVMFSTINFNLYGCNNDDASI
jgi:hypothetical protein